MQNNFYIAGASSRSRTARVYLEYLNPNMIISAFLVSPEMTDNEPVVDDVPVLPITSSFGQGSTDKDLHDETNGYPLDTSLPVYLGTRGVNHPKLEAELRAIGFSDIIPVNMELDSKLRNAYLTKFYAENGISFVRMDMLDASSDLASDIMNGEIKDNKEHTARYNGVNGEPVESRKSAGIYVACSIFDGELKHAYTPIPEEKRIQVGSALTDKRIEGCDYLDNKGENISSLNKQFCELTGLYWIWKHATEDYVGLVHYRRHFLLSSNWVEVCRKNAVDVILPVPLYVNPSVSENYRERHVASDWDYLMEHFKKNLPDEYDSIVRILGGNLYNPCNMIIAGREVLDELCGWMFPIIFDVYEHSKQHGIERDSYQSRFPGFISERLITYYFESRRDKYNVVYCNKNFLN